MGRRAGVLLGEAGGADVIDSAVVLLAHDGDEIFSSDPEDLRQLAYAAGTQVDVIQVWRLSPPASTGAVGHGTISLMTGPLDWGTRG